MKKLLLSSVFSLAVMMLMAANGFQVEYSQPQNGAHQLQFELGNYAIADISLQGTTYSMIDFEGKIVTQKWGFAALPYLNATVMLDPMKNVTLEFIAGDYVDIQLNHPLVPSRGVIYRNQDPSSIPYVIDPKSLTDNWYPEYIAENTEPFIIRDIRGTSVYVYPFQYNAVQQTLRVYSNLTVRLVENTTPSVNPLPKEPEKILREMDGVYRSVFINYSNASRDLTIGEFGDILVVTTSRDETAIEPYIEWKREKGHNVFVEVVPANTVVNATVQNAYNDNNDILYVLLVGDWADIKCTTTGSGRPMDPQVGCVVGTDQFADIAVGRFSANSPADVTVQVEKVINYEKLPETGALWYQSATGIASNEGAGIGDDGESDIQHNNVIWNNKLNPFTYETYSPIYEPSGTIAMVNTAVNTGTTVINYTGHGWGQGWGTTGFSNSNVAGLTNGNKLPFIISVACNNGDYDLGTCFGEAWVRKADGGAIMFLGGSISQPWAPPMRGQDYFMDVLIGGYDYTAYPGQNGISTTEQRTTLGSIVFNGLTLMCTESGGSSDWETAKTWIFFGDPSLQARTAPPDEILLSSNLVMTGIPFTTTITGSGGPVADAMVTLSQDGQYFTGITDQGGNVTIAHELNPGNALLVVTAFNTTTIYEELNVIPPGGPYLILTSVEINDSDANGNGKLDYGETVYLSIGLTNVGSGDALDVMVDITTENPFVEIEVPTASYGVIPAGDTVYVTDGFQVTADALIPDKHVVFFGLEATGTAREVWNSNFNIMAHAPVLKMANYQVQDPEGNNNGRLDPGETATITIAAYNSGSADAYSVTGELTTTSPYVTITVNNMAYGDLPAGETDWQSFQITINEDTPSGHAAVFAFNIIADMGVSGLGGFTEYVGQIPVLLVDWDKNHNSPDVIAQCLENLEVGHNRVTNLPMNLNLYSSIFICLGVYPDNTTLTPAQGQMLANFLDQGGNIYLEGGDTWYYDQISNPTVLHPMFNIVGIADGSGDLSVLQGQENTIVEDMIFPYNGDNSYIDHIGPVEPAVMLFMNSNPVYGTAVIHDAETYRTIGMSCEFGGLQDGEHTRDDLMMRMLMFFGIQGVWTSTPEERMAEGITARTYPNPFRNETVIRFENESGTRVSVDIFNISGQHITSLLDADLGAGIHEVRWDGTAHNGGNVPEGLYFYRIQTGNGSVTGKMMRMR